MNVIYGIVTLCLATTPQPTCSEYLMSGVADDAPYASMAECEVDMQNPERHYGWARTTSNIHGLPLGLPFGVNSACVEMTPERAQEFLDRLEMNGVEWRLPRERDI